jgi:succinate-acetate transporter protein
MANDMQNEIRERYNSLVEMNAIKGSLRSSEGVNIPGLTSEQFEILLNRIAGPPPPPPIPAALGNPGPLGLAAFALTTFMLSVFNAGSNLIDPKLESVVLPVALFYGGIAQFAAGMWEFRINNTFGATAFTSYGAFWMSFAAYVYLIVPTLISTGNVKQANGLFLFSWLIFTLYMTVAAYRTSRVLFTLFVVLSITFLLLVIGNLTDNGILVNVGGSEMS